jgi:hypothetical protein
MGRILGCGPTAQRPHGLLVQCAHGPRPHGARPTTVRPCGPQWWQRPMTAWCGPLLCGLAAPSGGSDHTTVRCGPLLCGLVAHSGGSGRRPRGAGHHACSAAALDSDREVAAAVVLTVTASDKRKERRRCGAWIARRWGPTGNREG